MNESKRAAHARREYRKRQMSRARGWGRYDRAAVFARDRWACVYCATPVRVCGGHPDDQATIDHALPLCGKSASGLDVIFNVVTACRRCNTEKCDRTETEYRALLAARQVEKSA